MPKTAAALLPALLALLLGASGCAFFVPPDEPPPPDDPTDPLSCGETRDVTGLSGADSIPLVVGLQTNYELIPNFEDPSLGMRLTIETDTAIERSLELWDSERDLRLIPGSHSSEAELTLELLGTSSLFEGTIALECSQPDENCFNLTDDDGDGRVDCADLSCAWHPGCVEDQQDLEAIDLVCGDNPIEVTPTVGSTDKQRTLYRIHPGGLDQPGLGFWGGAELVIRSVDPAAVNIEMTLGSAGLVCIGPDNEDPDAESVECEDWATFEAGVVGADPTEMPIFLEPLGERWESLSISVDCATP